MNSDTSNEPTRSDKPGWSVIASSDNGFDLLQFVITVADFDEATQVGTKVASLIQQYERIDDIFNTQITLRGWQVEVQLALPTATWGTVAQQEFTDAIVALQMERKYENDKFIADSYNLKNTLLKQAATFTDDIDKLERTTNAHIAYYAYLKDFLINSGSLCDDIVFAANNGAVLLAMIGTRSLIEDTLNILYIESKTVPTERMGVASEWFDISNDPTAQKNQLDGKSIKERAKATGTDAKQFYEKDYITFCNYAHGSAQRAILNIDDHRELAKKKAIMVSLQSYANIIEGVAGCIDKNSPTQFVRAVKAYLENYNDSVALATIGLPQMLVGTTPLKIL